MRAELPWNVAGIPPEAREAARAAARREGLSVGEWLTRRILRNLSGLEDDVSVSHTSSGAPLDSWGLPQSEASRRDSEEMLAHVGRTETESNETWRRIEDHLKGLGRRLETSERSHSENNRVLSRTAQEMNITAREQSQAFDQLGQNIAALSARLERLERGATNDSIKEAIKALHLGLSRLADQITATTGHSASQLAQVTDNLEKLAGHVGQFWEDADAANQLLERRLDVTEKELAQRIDSIGHGWDARLSAAEKTAQFNANALDHALEKIEAAADQRVADQADYQRRTVQQDERAARHEENVQRLEGSLAELGQRLPGGELEDRLAQIEMRLPGAELEDRLSGMERRLPGAELEERLGRMESRLPGAELEDRLSGMEKRLPGAELEDRLAQIEMRLPDPEMENRLLARMGKHLEKHLPASELEDKLEEIQHSVSGLTERMRQEGPEKFEAPLQALTHRLEKLEQDHAELLAEMRTKLVAVPELEKAPEKPSEPPSHQEPFFHESAEPLLEAEPPVEHAFEAPPFTEPALEHEEPALSLPRAEVEELDDFTPQQHLDFDIPDDTQTVHDDNFLSEFGDAFAERDEPENFLAQARRSARAASEQAESEGRNRLSAFRWSQNAEQSTEQSADAEQGEEKAKPRYLVPLIVALVVVIAAAAALLLSQRARTPVAPPAKPVVSTVIHPVRPAASASKPVLPPQENPMEQKSLADKNARLSVPPPPPAGNAGDFSSQRSAPASSDTTARTAPPAATKPPVKTATVVNPAKPAIATAPVKSATAPTPVKPVTTVNPVKPTIAPAPVKPTTAPALVKPAPIGAAPALDRVVQSANAGNPTALAILGLRALDGVNGAPVNLQDAVKFLTQAAEKGQAVAQYRLGTLYERGQGVPTDTVKAMHWYELAANQGNRKAMHNLAVAYASAPPGKRNMTEAARWFAKAAALGLSDSQFNLAVLYERGDGVPQSLVDAYKWYSVAAAAGDAESKGRIGVLQTQLSEADKASASRSAAAFHAAPLNRIANVPPESADLGR
jgi:localization factor PodJL